MRTANQTKNLHYLDRDTDLNVLCETIIFKKRSELMEFLEYKQNILKSKEAGEFFTIEDITKCKDGGLEKMFYFFRAAVVPYYFRQSYDFWEDKIERQALIQSVDEMKQAVGFTLYNLEGKKTEKPNSMTVFKTIKELREFLTMIEDVCFNDNGYVFPDSKHFNTVLSKKGREATKLQMLGELKEKHKNKFKDRDIV